MARKDHLVILKKGFEFCSVLWISISKGLKRYE